MRRTVLNVSAAVFLASGCSPADAPRPELVTRHAEEIEAYFSKRVASLTRPDGFLSLAGLHWLKEGSQSVGSSKDSEVRLPENAPARLGTLIREGGRVRFKAAPGASVKIGDETATQGVLYGPEVASPPLVSAGSVSFHVIERTGKIGVRIKDSENPALKNFKGVERFPVDWNWRVRGAFVPYQPPRKVSVPNVLGTSFTMDSPGEIVFRKDGRTYRIETLGGPEDRDLWIIFGDATNGRETYGAGRFLEARRNGDHAVIDFNKAYNPPCAFTPYATCPVPRESNKLKLRVTAGEKAYAHALKRKH